MLVITGSSGNVGNVVTQLLASRVGPTPFRIAAHNPQKVWARYGSAAPCVAFDYDDRSTWPAVLADVDTLFLVFPLPHPRTVHRWMTPFVDAAVSAGCRHVVYLTVPGADTYRVIPHYAVERHIEASGVNYTFLRPTYFMQNLCRRISTHGVDIAERGEIFVPAGDGRTTFIDARDVALVALQIFEQPQAHRGASYTLSGPDRLDFFAAAEIFSEAMGRPIRYANPSFPHFWYRLWRRGVAWDVILFMTMVYTLARFGKNDLLTDEVSNLLGREPIPMRQFVEDYRWRWERRSWT